MFSVFPRKFLLVPVCLAVMASLLSLPAQAAKKALIIGNNQYQHAETLFNAVNDAQDMERQLSRLGFDTHLVINGDRRGIARAVSRFADDLGPGDKALFFYSGHGIHARGTNYLIPVDAKLDSEEDLEVDSLSAEAILKRIIDAGPDLGIMLLDACRNNPLKRRSRGLSRGLGLMQLPGGVRGTLIGYAAGIGETADDNAAHLRNGLYTGALLTALHAPGLTIEQIMKKVRHTVSRQSGGRQNPWTLASLQGDFIPNDLPVSTPARNANLPDIETGLAMPAPRPQNSSERIYRIHDNLDSMLDEITNREPAKPVPDTATTSAPQLPARLQKKSGGDLEDFMRDLMETRIP